MKNKVLNLLGLSEGKNFSHSGYAYLVPFKTFCYKLIPIVFNVSLLLKMDT